MCRLRIRDKSLLALGLLALAALLRQPPDGAIPHLWPARQRCPASQRRADSPRLLLCGIPAAVLLRQFGPARRGLPGTCVLDHPPLCALLGVGAQYLLQGISWLWIQLLSYLPLGVVQGVVMMPRNLFEGLLAFCALAVVPALVEETLFRGAVYPCLLRAFSQRTAFWLTVGTFTLMHGSLTGLPAHLGVGWLATALLVRRGRLGASILFSPTTYNGMGRFARLLPVAAHLGEDFLGCASLRQSCRIRGAGAMDGHRGQGAGPHPLPQRLRAACVSASGLTPLLALGYLPELCAPLWSIKTLILIRAPAQKRSKP